MVGAGHGTIGVLQRPGEKFRERSTLVDDLRTECDQALVPDIESAQLVSSNATRTCRLQKCVALFQHSLIVSDHTTQPWRVQHE